MIRLDKYLADMGIGTRSAVKQMIRKGQVQVNQETAARPELKIDEQNDKVQVNGQTIGYTAFEHYMLHKPAGVVSATEDKRDKTVIDLIESRKRKDLFPVGRLDKDTEGLLLITNDGALAHQLLAPKKHVNKVYYAKVHGWVTEDTVSQFAKGLNIGTDDAEEWTRPAKLVIVQAGDDSEIRLTIQEGKFHQVKRMFQAVGMEVTYLKRESMGSLVLDETLKPGEYRELTTEELENL